MTLGDASCFVSPARKWFGFCLLTITLSLFAANPAEAFQGSWGGSFGSGGSHGSSGGLGSSGGSWGSRGGILYGRQPVRNLLSRVGNRLSNLGRGSHGSFGSSGGMIGHRYGGSFGSSGGSSGYRTVVYGGSYGSTGGWRVRQATMLASPQMATNGYVSTLGTVVSETSYPVGSYGFDPNYPVCNLCPPGSTIAGATMQEAMGNVPATGTDGEVQDGGPIDPLLEQNYYDGQGQPAQTETPVQGESGQAAPAEGTGGLGPDDSTSVSPRVGNDQAILRLQVPEDAKVYINDRLTKTPGTLRSYESNHLVPGQEYFYQVKVEVERNGQRLLRSKLVSLKPGNDQTVAMRFDEPAVTTLALNVPEDAKVTLCGKQTALEGPERTFVTSGLVDGQICEDYTIEVAYQRDGKLVTDIKKIDLVAGDMRTLTFGAREDRATRVASR